MPFYDYQCQKCGHIFEVFQHMDDPDPRCPSTGDIHVPDWDFEQEGEPPVCGGHSRRLISQTNFVLKGDGWAADGYSSGGKR
jgi:putative FmdB family regulatory protein